MEDPGNSHRLSHWPSQSVDLGDFFSSGATTADGPAPVDKSRRDLKTLRDLGYRYCDQCERVVQLQIMDRRRDLGSSFLGYVLENPLLSLILSRGTTTPARGKKIWGCPSCGRDYRRLNKLQKKHISSPTVRSEGIPRRFLILIVSVPMIALAVGAYALLPTSDRDREPSRSPGDGSPLIAGHSQPLTPRVVQTHKKQTFQALGETQGPDRTIPEIRAPIDLLKEGPPPKNKGDFGRNPQDPVDNYERGVALFDKKDYNGAITDFTNAIKINPRCVAAYRYRGLAFYHNRQYDEAIADFSKAVSLEPQNATDYCHRGLAKFDNGQEDLAIDDYSKAININPKYAAAYSYRGLARFHEHQYDLAIADFTMAIGQDPQNDMAYYNRGCANYEKKNYDSAIADFSKAIHINPKLAIAYSYRAAARRALNKFDTAADADEDTAKRLNDR